MAWSRGVLRSGATWSGIWGEALFSIRHSPSLSEDEKAAMLGRTARRILNWPAPDTPQKPAPLHPHRLGHED